MVWFSNTARFTSSSRGAPEQKRFNCSLILSLAAAQDVNTNISTSTLSPSVPSSTSSYPTDHVSMSTNFTTTISPSSRNVTNLTTTTLPATTFHEGKFLSAQHSADL